MSTIEFYLKLRFYPMSTICLNPCSHFILYVLASGSVCLCFIHFYYQNCHAMLKYKIVFNQVIRGREFFGSIEEKLIKHYVKNNISLPFRLNTVTMYPLSFLLNKNKINRKRKL